jgi:hypothetical protein
LSEAEASLALPLRARGLTGFEREVRFHPERRWRLDLGHRELRIGAEIHGGIWSRGRHMRGSGFLNDLEKQIALTRWDSGSWPATRRWPSTAAWPTSLRGSRGLQRDLPLVQRTSAQGLPSGVRRSLLSSDGLGGMVRPGVPHQAVPSVPTRCPLSAATADVHSAARRISRINIRQFGDLDSTWTRRAAALAPGIAPRRLRRRAREL